MIIKIRCNCGKEHTSFEEWQACPLALVPRPLDYRQLYGITKEKPDEHN